LEQNGSVRAQDEPCGQAAREKDYRLFSWLKLPASHQDGLFDFDGDNLPLGDLCSDYFKDRVGFFGAILNGIYGFHCGCDVMLMFVVSVLVGDFLTCAAIHAKEALLVS
jgi:hypothetical protein